MMLNRQALPSRCAADSILEIRRSKRTERALYLGAGAGGSPFDERPNVAAGAATNERRSRFAESAWAR